MNNLSKFCTCGNLECPLHPTKHDRGCAPCIKKNLMRNELPSCFFKLVDNAKLREGDSFEDFAKLIMDNLKNKE